MTLTLDLPSEIAEAITQAATRQGRSREELTTAEGTWHIWDTPEEDKAWAPL